MNSDKKKSGLKPKLLVIVGPTAVGKSNLAVELASQFRGEVISADSRQIYSGLDVGTGKVTKKERQGVPHHCIDIADPKKQITVTEYKKQAKKSISEIIKNDKLPVLVGGTGLYIKAVIDDVIFPEVAPDIKLREKLEQKDIKDLFEELNKKDPMRAKTIQPDNKRRLVRALEIVDHNGKVPPIAKTESPYNLLIVGLHLERDKLREKIEDRLKKRLQGGMIEEAEKLHEQGLSFERMEEFGLEYRHLSHFLQQKTTRQELEEKLTTAIWRYARRQLSWFNRDNRIEWFKPVEKDKITTRVESWLKNNGN